VKIALGPLEGERVSLRLLTESDLPLTMAWRNKPRCRIAFRYAHLLSPAGHLAWFRSYLDRDDDFVFVIEEKASRRPVGQIALYRIDRKERTAELGRLMIGEDAALGRGFALEAIGLAGRAARSLCLGRLTLEVKTGNEAALRLYLKAGFVELGRREGWSTMSLELPC